MMFGWDVSSYSSSSFYTPGFRFQAWNFVARWAEKTRARGGIPYKSLLEVLSNPHADGHFFPPPYNGGRLCWTREYRPNPPFPLCSAVSANMIQHGRRVGVPSPGVFLKKSLYPISRWSGNWSDTILGDYKAFDSETHINTVD